MASFLCVWVFLVLVAAKVGPPWACIQTILAWVAVVVLCLFMDAMKCRKVHPLTILSLRNVQCLQRAGNTQAHGGRRFPIAIGFLGSSNFYSRRRSFNQIEHLRTGWGGKQHRQITRIECGKADLAETIFYLYKQKDTSLNVCMTLKWCSRFSKRNTFKDGK